jgi:tetratricopeptide (TPR) repeat protein
MCFSALKVSFLSSLLTSALICSISQAQSKGHPVTEHFELGLKAYAAKHYKLAESNWLISLKDAKDLDLSPAQITNIYNHLGKAYQAQNKMPKAQDMYEKALALVSKDNGSDSAQAANSYYNLGQLFFEQEKYKAAAPYLEKAIVLHQKYFGNNFPGLRGIYKRYAVCVEKLNLNPHDTVLASSPTSILQ